MATVVRCFTSNRTHAWLWSNRERHGTGEFCWAHGNLVTMVVMRKLIEVCRDAQLGIAKTSEARPTAFEAVPLIKPPASPGVSDSFIVYAVVMGFRQFQLPVFP
jgi:hypothetical protein